MSNGGRRMHVGRVVTYVMLTGTVPACGSSSSDSVVAVMVCLAVLRFSCSTSLLGAVDIQHCAGGWSEVELFDVHECAPGIPLAWALTLTLPGTRLLFIFATDLKDFGTVATDLEMIKHLGESVAVYICQLRARSLRLPGDDATASVRAVREAGTMDRELPVAMVELARLA